ncbi:DUF4296 domain-containing protein [Aequorivita sp. CIP111184]|uniref:DUF4296 domain-containing protein n=1 Tax=Aequorivita sp. CIP111184 TaxID=2211356 RepID=UPI000DBC402B|nr:DUF4296 domain-containing protein [Aequorivita sp. CIP111184]SRX52286.1 hypothetical protein AEQU1_00150 [Aequorivita sp. CIP111184]
MKHWIIILVFMLGFFGCQDVKQPEKPKNLISKDKMIDMLTEAYLANAARSVDNKSIISKGIKMDSLIYKNFDVDSIQFAKSNDFYAADVNVYMDIFQKVEGRLTGMQKKMDSIREVEIELKDSISKKSDTIKLKTESVKDSLI